MGNHIIFVDGKSTFGASFHAQNSSKLNIKLLNIFSNAVNEYGGAIYCKQSQVTFEYAILLNNYAELEGGGIFGEACSATFDHCKFVNNTALANGGGMYFTASSVEIHNSEVDSNIAKIGNFGLITRNSKFQSNYLYLPEAKPNWISIFNNSVAEMKHTYLSNLNSYCSIIARQSSQIFVDSVYLTNDNYTRTPLDSDKTEVVVCTDDTSSANEKFGGNFIFFPEMKKNRL